jgi:hypothetical protein
MRWPPPSAPPTSTASRSRSPRGHDLGEEERRRAFDLARGLRVLEATTDPEGLSTTARAVLARIRR